MKSWVKELKRMLGNDIILCIVGNKIDLEKDRHVSSSVAEEYARSVNAKLYHTSAKSKRGIEDLFNDLAMRKFERRKRIETFVRSSLGMLERVPANANESNSSGGATPLRPGGIPTTNQTERKTGGSCC